MAEAAVTDISTQRKAEEFSDRELMSKAIRASGRGIKAGRVTSSVIGDDAENNAHLQVKKLFQQYQPLGYMLPWEILDYVELLATYNPDYSQAVENIKMLANSGHELIVDGPSDLQKKKVKDLLEFKARTIQEAHGGIDGVIDKLLDQAATYGCICGEWVLNDELTDVVDFVDLDPKKIRFFWDSFDQRFIPFQKVNGQQAREAKANGQEVRNNCIRLNEETFCYYAFDAAPESPYGTPPFLAALPNIAIQRDMVFNMAQIVKKIGLLGMVDLTIERLQPLPGETEAQYAARAAAYLDDYVAVAEEMVRDGGLVHFDDVSSTTMQLGGNAAGATNIHKANEELIFSGLKSMPSVQGRSFSTTETYAGVAYDIVLRNTMKYQRAVKRVIERGYWLMATMAGLQPTSISLKFNQNRSLNRMQEAAAERIEIANAVMKWIIGVYDQRDVAQELGVSDPKIDMEEPPESLISIASAHSIESVPDFDFQNPTTTRATMEGSDDEEEGFHGE